MIILILAVFPMLLTYCVCISSHVYHIVDNTFSSLDYSLPKNWIVLDEKEPLESPMFDTIKVEESTIQHVKNNLKNHLEKITLGFFYFNEETLIESKDRYVSGVRVSFKCSIPFSKSYYKAVDYVVSKVK